MSTRSTISIWSGDSFSTIYCHFDGYPDGVGAMLKQHYNTPEKINALIAMGDASSLGKNLEDSVFYARDRNEKDVAAIKNPTIRAIAHYSYQEFNYIFMDGRWVYFRNSYCEALNEL